MPHTMVLLCLLPHWHVSIKLLIDRYQSSCEGEDTERHLWRLCVSMLYMYDTWMSAQAFCGLPVCAAMFTDDWHTGYSLLVWRRLVMCNLLFRSCVLLCCMLGWQTFPYSYHIFQELWLNNFYINYSQLYSHLFYITSTPLN